MRILFTLLLMCAAQAQQPQLQWLELPNKQLEIDGLPWYGENGNEWIRLPAAHHEKFPPAVWNLAKSPSGGRIRFRTDSQVVAVRVEYPSPPDMRNMHAFGQTGVDLYADGLYVGTTIADKDAAPGKVYEHMYFQLRERPRAMRDVVLYLPLYKPAKVISVGVDKDAKLERASGFAAARPVVFYGTSITQGGCASRSGMSYQAILGRKLNLDFVNLGFSGNGKGEAEVANAVGEIDASVFVLDFAQNNPTVESLRAVYAPFVDTLRSKHPGTPIIAITPIYAAADDWSKEALAKKTGMRELIRKVIADRIAAGDGNLQLVEGTDLLGPAQGDGLVDGVHPNDLGFQWMADGLAARLRQVLGVK
ncbi:MAG: SGNH/GDSL hydrolase family protein [Bryobacteraceae bacterium]